MKPIQFLERLIVRKVGCWDCQQQWTNRCPLCKKKAKRIVSIDGRSLRRKRIAPEDKKKALNGNRPVRAKIEPIKDQKHQVKEGYADEKKYWLKKHPKRVVQLIMRGHDAACACCYVVDGLTFDHIVPVSKGGSNALRNGQILCHECNLIKDDHILTIEELRILVKSHEPRTGETVSKGPNRGI